MYKTMETKLKHLSDEEKVFLRCLCRTAKNLYNESLFTIRQHYFDTGEHLFFETLYKIMSKSNNYKILPANMSQQLIKRLCWEYKSFFAAVKRAKENGTKCDARPPSYLDKNGYRALIIQEFMITGDRSKFLLPISQSTKKRKFNKKFYIDIPKPIQHYQINEIRIIPKNQADYFIVHFVYDDGLNYNLPVHQTKKALAIDTGVSNLMTCVTSTGESFIVDGRYLKSKNQWYNKEIARLQSIQAKQTEVIRTRKKSIHPKQTKRMRNITEKRNRQMKDYIYKAAKYVINYCVEHQVDIVVFGWSDAYKERLNLGKVQNQMFVQIPLAKLRDRIEELCLQYQIKFVVIEESYTSQSSFFDKDILPTYDPNHIGKYQFSGKRVKRGLYKQKNGERINADVNGALNILRKSKVVSLDALYHRGVADTPKRIRL